MISVFDIDNCVSDDEWRLPLILPRSDADPFERYREYHEMSLLDDYGNAHQLRKASFIVFATSRPEAYRKHTRFFLKRLLGFAALPNKPFLLYMRANDDFRTSPEIKIEMVDRIAWNVGEIECCYDDRIDVIEAYKSIGIPAQRLYINKREDTNEDNSIPRSGESQQDVRRAQRPIQG